MRAGFLVVSHHDEEIHIVEHERPGPPDGGGSREGLVVRLLDAFTVEFGGSALGAGAFPRRKAHQLVKLLALHRHHRMHRDQVVEALWPHLAPEAGAHQLHNALSQARGALRTLVGRALDPVALEGGVVALRHPNGVTTDLHHALAAAGCALVDRSANVLEAALAPLLGTLLPEDLYEPWSEPAREEVRTMAARLRLALAEALVDERRTAEAVTIAEAVVRDEPTEESAYRTLMRAAAEIGDPTGVERAFQRCREALERDLGSGPSDETMRLLNVLRERSAPPRSATPLHEPATPFVGRTFELAEVERALAAPGCRLLSVTGIGGIGKTRLALEAARRLAARTSLEVAVVEVPADLSADHLLTLLADALSVRTPPREPREAALVEALAGRRLLVVLDNAEYVRAARALVARLLAALPGLTVLAATRHRLELQGERVVELGGLEVPRREAVAPYGRFAAVQLFLDAARRSSGVTLGQDEAEAVGRICRMLHGVPLALELAASWVGVLSCDAIVVELRRGLDLLVSNAVDAPERHRSLRHAFEQSWRLLDADERRHLARLSTFPAACDLDAARRVVGIPLRVMRSLSEKSLLSQVAPGRCAIHPVVRQFAAEKLGADEAAALAEAHARHYLDRLDGGSARLASGAERRVIHEIIADVPHFRAAFLHAVRARDVVGLDAGLDGLAKLFDKLGWHHEGHALFDGALAELTSGGAATRDPEQAYARLVARLEARAASFALALGRIDEAMVRLERSRVGLATVGDALEHAFTLDQLSLVLHHRGDDAVAMDVLAESLELRRRSGDLDAVATSLNNLGSMAFALGALEEAEDWCSEALTLQRTHGTVKGVVISLQNLASIRSARGDQRAAETLLVEGLALARSIESGSLTALFLGNLARLAAQRGEVDRAATHAREAIASALEVSATALAAGIVPTLASIAHQRGDAGDAVALCMLTLRTVSAGREARGQAEALMLRLAHDLDPAAMAAAQERGSALHLHDMLRARASDALVEDAGNARTDDTPAT